MRGIRGAITVENNSKAEIMAATKMLVEQMLIANEVATVDIGAGIFTATDDLTACFPARGAREIPGFELVPLFDARQMDVDDGLPMCIRALLLVETDLMQQELQHIYLKGAVALRPDLAKTDE